MYTYIVFDNKVAFVTYTNTIEAWRDKGAKGRKSCRVLFPCCKIQIESSPRRARAHTHRFLSVRARAEFRFIPGIVLPWKSIKNVPVHGWTTSIIENNLSTWNVFLAARESGRPVTYDLIYSLASTKGEREVGRENPVFPSFLSYGYLCPVKISISAEYSIAIAMRLPTFRRLSPAGEERGL